MATTVIVGGITPDLRILGDTQKFLFEQPNGTFRLANATIPLDSNPINLNLDFLNIDEKGYRVGFYSDSNNTSGMFHLSSLQYQQSQQNSGIIGTKLMTFNENGLDKFLFYKNLDINGNKIINVPSPVNNNDASNKAYIDSKVFDINTNTSGQLNINRLNGYPANGTQFLNGNGTWENPRQFTTNASSVTNAGGFIVNNTNPAAIAAGLIVQNNGTINAEFGFNNSTNEAYVWAYGTASLKFGTNGTKRAQILNNGTFDLIANNLTTTGTINATTGTLKGNNLAAYNAGSIVVLNPLAMNNNAITGLPTPVNAQDGTNKQYVDTAVSRSILHGYNAATYSTNVGVGDHLKFDSVAFSIGSGISLDTSTTYNTSTNTASIGRITLAGGKTYKLTGSINNVVSANYNATRWYNSDTNTALGLLSGAASPISTTDRVPSAGTITYITTSGTTRVELRITWNSFSSVNGTGDAIGPSWFTVETI